MGGNSRIDKFDRPHVWPNGNAATPRHTAPVTSAGGDHSARRGGEIYALIRAFGLLVCWNFRVQA